MNVIEAKGIKKQYQNGVWALQGMDVSVKKGEIFTLLGQNGAGKSTLINILTTSLDASDGTLFMLGQQLPLCKSKVRESIAYVMQRCCLDTALSLEENMILQSQLYGVPKMQALRRMETLIKVFDLEAYRHYPIISYSGGVTRRLDIAMHMMSEPSILFLDEPSVGMDVKTRNILWDMLKKLRDVYETTICMTTHDMDEAEALSDTICIMRDGKSLIQGTIASLRSYLHQEYVQLSFVSQQEAKQAEVHCQKLHPDIVFSMVKANIRFLSTHAQHDMERIAQELMQLHIAFLGIQIVQPSLEDVYLYISENQNRRTI